MIKFNKIKNQSWFSWANQLWDWAIGGNEEGVESYPQKKDRYYFGRFNAQYCLTPDEKNTIEHIHKKQQILTENKHQENSFYTIKTISQFYDWWHCYLPTTFTPQSISYTLPNREAKDATFYPLWRFADNMARQIANWQGERIKGQDISLMNDPTMMVFEELKNWFFNTLTEYGCKEEELLLIAERQSYIKQLLHELPDFGPDRLHLHEIGQRLEEAVHILELCKANKHLPDLLSDAIIKSKGLENTLGSYLHFLLINEEVSDNFSYDFIEKNIANCKSSPVCKAYTKAESVQQDMLTPEFHYLLKLNPFYHFSNAANTPGNSKATIQLKADALTNIKFADFVTQEDKQEYLSLLASLASIIQIRQTFEEYKSIQANLGAYIFAQHFLGDTKMLADNYIALVNQAQSQMQKLLRCADAGLTETLKKSNSQTNQRFLKNLKALETQFAQDTTAAKQLTTYCKNAQHSITVYQNEMQKLSEYLQNGMAASEIGEGMEHLVKQIRAINSFMPAQLKNEEIDLAASDLSLTSNSKHKDEELFSKMPAANNKHDLNKQSIIITSKEIHTDLSKLISEIKIDKQTGRPIFIYTFYANNKAIGSLELFDKPFLCFSLDKKRHNIIKQTGILEHVQLSDSQSTKEVCSNLPPTLLNTVLSTSVKSASTGTMRAISHVIGESFQAKGHSKLSAKLLTYFSYYSFIFTFNYYQFSQPKDDLDYVQQQVVALQNAAIATGQTIVMQASFDAISDLLAKASARLNSIGWSRTAKAAKTLSTVTKFGMFAANLRDQGVLTAGAALVSGTIAQTMTEKYLKKALNY